LVTKVALSWFFGYLSQFVVGSAMAMVLIAFSLFASQDFLSTGSKLFGAVFNSELTLRITGAFFLAILIAWLVKTHKQAIICSVIINMMVVATLLLTVHLA